MKVLVVGGTGYIGTAVVEKLRSAGHQPVILTRRTGDPRLVDAEVRTGDLTRPDSLRAAVTDDIDAIVHAASPTGDWDADLAALTALTDSLGGRPILYLSGVWVLGATGDVVDESAATSPIELVSRRVELERHVVAGNGVRGTVIRPGIVHGAGGGIPAMMVDWARTAGIGRYVGEPTVRWPMVHVSDLADLVVLVLEQGAAGGVLHAVAESAVPVRSLAEAADLAAGGRGAAEPWTEQDAAASLGAAFAEALALSQVVAAPAARQLGWRPSGAAAVEDVASGSHLLTPA